MSFSDLGLDAGLLSAVSAAGYTDPTPVQREAIPAALSGVDLLVSSHTGSGKTAAFMLPALQRLLQPSATRGRGPRVLVLTPTRELALQVNKAALDYGRGLRQVRTAALVGGSSYALQLRALERPLDVVVATPGRLIDHIERGRIDLSRVEVLILDEADRMLDMGFVDDVETIVSRTPATRQTMLFSATLEGVVGDLARRLTRDARRIEVATSGEQQAKVEQIVLYADDLAHKSKLLDALLRDPSMTQCVVFAATKMAAEQISLQLEESGFSAAPLHGDMHQGQRNRTLRGLREGRTRVLVATDVAARGIDVAGISHVINFDSPRQAEDYVHRIGRTGRAGRTGTAVTLMGHHERHRARDIERYTGQPLRIETIAGLEPRRRPAKPAWVPGKPGHGARPGYSAKHGADHGAGRGDGYGHGPARGGAGPRGPGRPGASAQGRPPAHARAR
ncbi:MAG: DEAD/DEAH box helicase [Betaproteobacteria bacterium]|nr:DEAD/DEAH box helicase [Betaproteobacteria bacterium]